MRYQAVYRCTPDHWAAINRRHEAVLRQHVLPDTKVLEVGCGWGRLLDIFPSGYHGAYTGIDLSPEFVALAKAERPSQTFICGRAEDVLRTMEPDGFDLGVVVSIRQMLRDNGQSRLWRLIELDMMNVCKKLLVLEYDPDSDGEVL